VHCDPDHALSDGAPVDVPLAVRPPDGGAANHSRPAIGRSICLEPVTRRGWGQLVPEFLPDGDTRAVPARRCRRSSPRSVSWGLGLIGGSIAASCARALGPRRLVIRGRSEGCARGRDAAARDRRRRRRPDRPGRSRPRGVGSAGAPETSICCRRSTKTSSRPAIVTDTGSTKREIASAGPGALAPAILPSSGGHPPRGSGPRRPGAMPGRISSAGRPLAADTSLRASGFLARFRRGRPAQKPLGRRAKRRSRSSRNS